MDFRTATVLFLTLAGSFWAFNEFWYLPYMSVTDYSSTIEKLKEPFRPLLVFLGSLGELGLLAGGLWAGNIMVNLYNEGDKQSGQI